jgi:hypothetical protein
MAAVVDAVLKRVLVRETQAAASGACNALELCCNASVEMNVR